MNQEFVWPLEVENEHCWQQAKKQKQGSQSHNCEELNLTNVWGSTKADPPIELPEWMQLCGYLDFGPVIPAQGHAELNGRCVLCKLKNLLLPFERIRILQLSLNCGAGKAGYTGTSIGLLPFALFQVRKIWPKVHISCWFQQTWSARWIRTHSSSRKNQ